MSELLHSAVDPEQLYETLSAEAHTRTQKSLKVLHGVCRAQADANNGDFSIATIARLSAANGGAGDKAIRNNVGPGPIYRQLIEAWANYSGGRMKKPAQRVEAPAKDYDILARIDDPALRAVVGSMIAEKNKLQRELKTLKASTNVVIDKRIQQTTMTQSEEEPSVEVLPALHLLDEGEKQALTHAISDKLLTEQGWQATETGAINQATGRKRRVYQAGYLTAIRKILDAAQ